MKKRKVIQLVLLMVLSQLALTVFVSWWLVHQYNNEKTSLKQELWRKFADTERQVSDSVIFRNFVIPLTGGKDKEKRIAFKHMSNMEIHGGTDAVKNSHSTITIEVNDTNFHKLPKVGMVRPGPGKMPFNEMMMGIKMIIAQETDSSEVAMNYQWNVEADSGLFKQLFMDKVNAMGLKATWVQRRSINGKQGQNIVLYSGDFKNIPAADIKGYGGYLFGRIWPQVMFGVLLVLLTATAFIIAYRSIRSQQKLHVLREDFVSNISHELKTPLSTAKVTIEALKTFDERKRAEVMHEYLNIAEAELERLDELVNKVLQTGLSESKVNFIHPRPVDLTALVNEVATAFRAKVRDKKLVLEIKPHGPVHLMLDPLHVQGVLYNLFDNAAKYNTSDTAYIAVWTEEQENNIILHVSDNGPGIPADYREKVFDKFFRVPSGDVHNVKGHGLGLSYSRQVMEKHGGKITLQTNAEGGTTFILYFPKK